MIDRRVLLNVMRVLRGPHEIPNALLRPYLDPVDHLVELKAESVQPGTEEVETRSE